jgi:hypothetical protein
MGGLHRSTHGHTDRETKGQKGKKILLLFLGRDFFCVIPPSPFRRKFLEGLYWTVLGEVGCVVVMVVVVGMQSDSVCVCAWGVSTTRGISK